MTFVRVIVPCDCEKGYTFQVVVDGRIAEVTCPRTVTAGETIEVDAVYLEGPLHPPIVVRAVAPPSPSQGGGEGENEVNTVATTTASNIPTAVPLTYLSSATTSSRGTFQYTLCSCCDDRICCRAVWWNTYLLQCIPVSQLLNRFRWNACAAVSERNRAVTERNHALLLLVLTLYYWQV